MALRYRLSVWRRRPTAARRHLIVGVLSLAGRELKDGRGKRRTKRVNSPCVQCGVRGVSGCVCVTTFCLDPSHACAFRAGRNHQSQHELPCVPRSWSRSDLRPSNTTAGGPRANYTPSAANHCRGEQQFRRAERRIERLDQRARPSPHTPAPNWNACPAGVPGLGKPVWS